MAFELSKVLPIEAAFTTILPSPPEPIYGPCDLTTADAGLFGPGSVTWLIHSDPVAAIAGVRALLMQTLHPVAMRGVAAHSAYREDPWGRLGRTAEFVSVVSFGTTAEAQRAGDVVQSVHKRLGVDAPDLLRWVHAGFVDSLLTIYQRGVGLSDTSADTYVAEQARAATMVGLPADSVPRTVRELRNYIDVMRPILRADDVARDAARFVLAPPMSTTVRWLTPAQPLWAGLAATAFASLPGWARAEFGDGAVGVALRGLPGLTDAQATLAIKTWRTALDQLPPNIRKGPWVKAAEARLGIEI
jgi:uncharacterized protein (DUF2236 family)